MPDAVQNNHGRKVDIQRDTFGRITQITHPRGNSVDYQYDGAGNLARVFDRLNDPSDPAAASEVSDNKADRSMLVR